MTERTVRPLTEVEQITIEHIVSDQAARFYGQRGCFHFGKSDAVRYVTEGFIGKALTDVDWAVLWTAVENILDEHPEILDAGQLTEQQITDRNTTRAAAADVYDKAAADAFNDGDYPLAVALVDAAERECPNRPGFRGWDDLRTFVADKYSKTIN